MSNSPTLKSAKSIAPQTPSSIYDNSQIQNKAIASRSPNQNSSLPIASQFSLPN